MGAIDGEKVKFGTTAYAAIAKNQGFLYFIKGGPGVADKLYCIMKGADNNYTAIQVSIG